MTPKYGTHKSPSISGASPLASLFPHLEKRSGAFPRPRPCLVFTQRDIALDEVPHVAFETINRLASI
jgi:DNA gyrase inhibitor GyrI